ncbi:MAG: tetratricopeptide repeat protein [Chloroflexi bacterium]|nr:tetratricopeptide repeat protein [Chloroflexota bacterium]MCI0647500.1 tetratricopeptide repeat protein [Chloroflexota bacterium]
MVFTPYTRFIGRTQERQEIQELLETSRLLTLTGPGGGGKTRLALQAAADLGGLFRDGVSWCDLASLADEAYVPQAVATAVHVAEEAGRSPADTLAEALRPRQALLVWDNCEHVLGACATLAHALLAACPEIKILVTSLQPLGLPLEKVWTVPPLAIEEAVTLFVDRAAEVLPSFTLDATNEAAVRTICRRLDGLPLAIELAAARVKMLAPAQIVGRLDDAFRLLTRGTVATLPRHQTLRATMEWSYHFLSEPEQRLFRRLSVFAGSFTLEMVEAICGEGLEEPGVLDLLTDLADKSLVSILRQERETVARYRLLETVRQYAREKLEASGETAEIRTHLLEWCTTFVEQAEPKLAGPEAALWLARLEVEQDNLRAALQWVRTGRAVETGLRLAGSAWFFWLSHGHLTEGRNWLEELLALEANLPDSPVSPSVRAKALYAAAVLAFRQGDQKRAATLAEASANLLRAPEDRARLGVSLNLLGILATEQGDLARATAIHEESLALYRSLGDSVRASSILVNLGIIARQQGEYRRAIALYEEALTLKRQLGDTIYVAPLLNNLGEVAFLQGEYPRAAALLDESLLLYRDLGSQNGVALVLNALGVLARHQQNPAQAKALLEESVALHQQTGQKVRVAIGRLNLGDLARDEGEWARAQTIYADSLARLQEAGEKWGCALAVYSLGLVSLHQQDDSQAAAQLRESLALYRTVGYTLGMVEGLEALAGLLARQGEPERAARWLGTAEAGRQAMGTPIPLIDREQHEQLIARVQAALDREALAAAWAEGRATGLAEAVAEALGRPEAAVAEPAGPVLQIFALGPARVVVGGRALAAPDWTYTKSKELLFYLLSHPPVTKGQIGVDLWPEASAGQLRNIFHRAIYYLRQALGYPGWVVFADNIYTFQPDVPFRYDVQLFDEELRRAKTTQARPEKIAALETAVALWRGDFLEDLDAGEWAIIRREELRRLFLKALADLGQLYFAEARYEKAAETYQQILAHDNYLELAHRELLRCYTRQGETGQALRHYQQLRQLLRDEMQAAPSPETTFLYERIQRGDDV